MSSIRDLGRLVAKQGEPAFGDLLAVLVLVDGHRAEYPAGVASATTAECVGEFGVSPMCFELDQGGEIEGVHQRELGEIEPG